MSGIGHLAPGFAAKYSQPEIPLLILLLASETNDILYGVFSTVGIEPKSSIASMDFTNGIKYLSQVANPWSHGFFMSLVWAGIAFGITYLITNNRQTSGVIGLVVFSHWIFDFLMHSNLPLFFNGSPLIGLGLENSGSGFLFVTVLDLLMLAIGIWLYIIGRKRNTTKRNLSAIRD